MVGSVDIAHVAGEVAATHPTLAAPARVIAMRAQGEAEIAGEQGITAYDGKTWASSHQIATNQVIPLPDPARRGLVNLTNDDKKIPSVEPSSENHDDESNFIGTVH